MPGMESVRTVQFSPAWRGTWLREGGGAGGGAGGAVGGGAGGGAVGAVHPQTWAVPRRLTLRGGRAETGRDRTGWVSRTGGPTNGFTIRTGPLVPTANQGTTGAVAATSIARCLKPIR